MYDGRDHFPLFNADEIRSTSRRALTWWTHISQIQIPRHLNHRMCWIHIRGNKFHVRISWTRLKQVYLHGSSGCLNQTQYHCFFGGTGDAIACLSETIRFQSSERDLDIVSYVGRHRDVASINSAWPCVVLTKSGLRIRSYDKDTSYEHCHRYNVS